MPVRDKISSLAVSKTSGVIGTAYGDHKLLQLPKDAFTSIPQSRSMSLAISPEERARLVKGMSVRDQAMYAFFMPVMTPAWRRCWEYGSRESQT